MHHHGSTASSLISSHQQPAEIYRIRHGVSRRITFRTELLPSIMTIGTITKVLLLLLAFLTLGGVSGEEKLRGRRPGEQQTERKIQACDKDSRLKIAQGLDNRPGGSGGAIKCGDRERKPEVFVLAGIAHQMGADQSEGETLAPTGAPTLKPTKAPTKRPTVKPTKAPTKSPTRPPTKSPTKPPTRPPTQNPTKSPVNQTNRPTTPPPTLAITFNPGDLTVSQNGLLLSTGLTSRIIAVKEQPVPYSENGQSSSMNFHLSPDAGATFADERFGNSGGWIYVSNSEIRENTNQGGVGAVTFDKNGNVIDYRMVLTGTRANCGGGRTPWGAWISCEEVPNRGQNWQVDPTGVRQSTDPITLGMDGGQFESFAYDIRNLDEPHFYVTEDSQRGALQRFTPDSPDWNDPWGILYGGGTTRYLLLSPNAYGSDGFAVGGVFSWSTNRDGAKENAERFYPNSEGIDVAEHELFFVSKRFKTLYVLNLDDLTYTNATTRSGLFDGQPDQIQRILGDDSNDLLYFTEDGGRDPGIHCRNEAGQFFTLLESPVYNDESTGLAFSPDGMHLYFALQETGLLYDVTRTDLLPFQAKSLNVKFHASNAG